MTIGEFKDCLKGYQDRKREEMVMQDTLNHIMASYVATGVNSPKKFPKTPVLQRTADRQNNSWTATTDEELMRRRRIQYGKR